ncbi:MAG: hypothetical protein HYX72_01055 [Acidobacteria bacterium]|nr:hypothetical protein [Acidobacteriota bacterium]
MPQIKLTSAITLLALAAGVFTASARDHKEFMTGRTGEVHFRTPVKVGDAVLKPGMYQVQHVLDGGEDIVHVNDHAIVFTQVRAPGGYRRSNNPMAKKPAVSIKCLLQPAAEKLRNTKVALRTNAAGEKELAELQIAGEPFKHLF